MNLIFFFILISFCLYSTIDKQLKYIYLNHNIKIIINIDTMISQNFNIEIEKTDIKTNIKTVMKIPKYKLTNWNIVVYNEKRKEKSTYNLITLYI